LDVIKQTGNTTAKEQITLISRFTYVFGKECIQGILADREFPNKRLRHGWSMKKFLFIYELNAILMSVLDVKNSKYQLNYFDT